jgi:hypothetical protein
MRRAPLRRRYHRAGARRRARVGGGRRVGRRVDHILTRGCAAAVRTPAIKDSDHRARVADIQLPIDAFGHNGPATNL